MKSLPYSALLLLMFVFGCSDSKTKYSAHKSSTEIKIDGIGNEEVWGKAAWNPINQNWIGDYPDSLDFHGRFKISWDENYLYVLAEIYDDSLSDTHTEPFNQYWDDDCLEIFVDEDASGGEHTYSFNAFAYHIALDSTVVDYGFKGPELFIDHVEYARKQNGKLSTWEVRISLYDDTFNPDELCTPVALHSGKVIGFALAYCDNDTSAYREQFMGSEFVPGEDKNRGYIDAGIFGKLELRN